MGNMGNAADSTWGNQKWTSSGNTTTDWTGTGHWYNRFRGPRYALASATLVLRQTKEHKPGTFANIGGVQFQRTTRRGRLHYYRAIA